MASPAKRAKPSSPAKPPGSPPPPPEDAPPEDPRVLLRRRWELASVLHFLQVFEPVIEADLGLSADEIETALITNNRDLARVHIALLKGIPPVSKNLNVDDGWVIETAKKLSDWWSWVAEGTNPFKANPGKEVETFKELDPVTRLFILKALCEVRSEQNDAVWYVNDEMKKGVNISNFRKEKLGSANDGSVYWYVGDSTVGHRLFKEDVTVDFKKNWKGKNGRLTKPVLNIHWETVATNLNEFLDISEKLCSKGRSESVIGEHLKENTVPAVEKFEKKKERELKRRQQKDERAFANVFQTRALRERKPVSYDYSDYDRSIKEAIKAGAKAKESDPPKEAGKKRKHVSEQGDNGGNVGSGISPENHEDREEEDAKDLDDPSSDDDEASDYNDKDDGSSSIDEDTDSSDSHESNSEEEVVVTRKRTTRLAARKIESKPRPGLRRSRRNMKSDDEEMTQAGKVTPEAMTKKTTRQRPTPISKQLSMSGTEDDDSQSGASSESGSEDDAVADSESGSEDDAVVDLASGSEDDQSEPDADSGEESVSP
uniref:Uncharacterized protein n=1 Tax=Avena sativa TaxID=4498 RepID=A0ACD5VPK5_AVESA